MSSRKFGKKSVYVFALQVALLLFAVASAPGAKDAYPAAFHEQANFLFNLFGGERVVRLSAPSGITHGADTKMTGFRRGHVEPRFTARYDIAQRGYWPLVIVAAMMIATPFPLLRRAFALVIAVALINAFTLSQVASLAFVSFRLAESGGESEVWQRASTAATGIFNSEIPRVVAVLLVWTLCALPAKTIDMRSVRTSLRALIAGRASPSEGVEDE